MMNNEISFNKTNGEIPKITDIRYGFELTILHDSNKRSSVCNGNSGNFVVEMEKFHVNEKSFLKPERFYNLKFEKVPNNNNKRNYRTEKLIELPSKFILSEKSTQTIDDESIDGCDQTDNEIKPNSENIYVSQDEFFNKTFDEWIRIDSNDYKNKSTNQWKKETYQFFPLDEYYVVKRNILTNEDICRMSYASCLEGTEFVIINDDIVKMPYRWMTNENKEYVKINTNTWQPIDNSWRTGVLEKQNGNKWQTIPFEWVPVDDNKWIRINSDTGKTIGKLLSSQQVVAKHMKEDK